MFVLCVINKDKRQNAGQSGYGTNCGRSTSEYKNKNPARVMDCVLCVADE
jgi:hypothetical protein